MEFEVLAFPDCLIESFLLSTSSLGSFVLRQGERQLPDALPRAPRAGAGQVCACAGLTWSWAHLAKALSLQSFGSPDLRYAPSIELMISAPF